ETMTMVRRWLTALCACLAGWASAQGASLPSFVNWSNDGAWQRENAFRAEIVLNGWWRWQLVEGDAPSPPTEGWRYRKAPGVGTRFRILDADGQSTILKGKDREAQLKIVTGECWAEREFTIPAAWRDRDVQLILENVTGDGEVWLNGQRVGHTWPLRPHHLDIPKPYRVEQPYRLTIRSSGILSNVWLKAHAPGAVRIEDSYLMTSVRAMTGMIRASGRGDVAAARVTITEHDAPGKVVKVAGPFPVDTADGKWQLEKSFDWKDAKLWSLESPNLYDYFLEALDKEGRVRDCIFPIRFGFREVWVKDGDFMLNHRRITLTMDIHTPLATQAGYGKDWGRAGHTANVEVWRRAFRRWKKLGVNTAVHRWSANVDDSALFQAADEEGFFISMDVFGLQYGNPDFQKIPSILAHTQDLNRYLILPRRHCPSVPFYYLPGTSNTWDFEPSKLGEDYDTEEVFGRHNRPERELVRQLDPSRVAFAHSGGGKGEPVHSSMNYIHIDADLQAHETWPSHWRQTRRKPLATYEMAAPPYIADWYQRRSRGEQAHGTPGVLPYFLEVGAIYLGEEPYLTESRATVEAWLDRAARKQSQMFPKWTVKSYEKSALLFTRNVYRAWRTYGVNMGFFTEV
ncbi:MAG: hypothetical protein FJ278_16325, partial [Planctomycetes bacterium]|nr:hypothetical protein [Planctomycetota bacterium]